MRTIIATAALITLAIATPASAQALRPHAEPAIVLVHGSLDDRSSFSDILTDIADGPYATARYDIAGPAAGDAVAAGDDIAAVARSVSARLGYVGGIPAGAARYSGTDRQLRAR